MLRNVMNYNGQEKKNVLDHMKAKGELVDGIVCVCGRLSSVDGKSDGVIEFKHVNALWIVAKLTN